MKPETIDTVIRHLKGIVAALEKEKDMGRPLDKCSDQELIKAAQYLLNNPLAFCRCAGEDPAIEELKSRGYGIGVEIDKTDGSPKYYLISK